jgi:hypothetical protein
MWAIRSPGPPTHSSFFVYDLFIILPEHIRWIEDILSPALVGILPSVSVVVKLYLTKSEEDCEKWVDVQSNTSSSEKLDKSDTSHPQPIVDSPLVSFENGRPDLQNVIQNEITNASGQMCISGTPKLIVGWDFVSPSFPQPAAPKKWQTQCVKLLASRAPWIFCEVGQP